MILCAECGHPTSRHYAHRMVDFPRERTGRCGDHTRCEICEIPFGSRERALDECQDEPAETDWR